MPALTNQPPFKTLLSYFHLNKTLPLIQPLHAKILTNGLQFSSLYASKLANVYIELGFLRSAYKVFDQITHKNLYSWNTMLSGYSKNNQSFDVLRIYKMMRSDIGRSDSFNLVFVIKACAELSRFRDGEAVHGLVVKLGFESDQFVVPRLINMYIDVECLDEAEKVFDVCCEKDLVVWGCMVKGCLRLCKYFRVFDFVRRMIMSGSEMDTSLLEMLVQACGNVLAGKEAKSCHGYLIKNKFLNCGISLQTSIIDSYMKCGFCDLGVKLFEEIPEKDVVSWTAVVAGFTKLGRGLEALGLFRQMLREAVAPNPVTFSSVILACSHMGSLELGKSVHCYMLRHAIELDTVNYTSFVDMYAKCGCIMMASRVFNLMPHKTVYSWTAMINGFGAHGMYSEAINLFDEMISQNQQPNSVTFVSILSACSHSGKVEEGWKYFNIMCREHGIVAKEEHFACMVDLLGRAGRICEALSLIDKMPMVPGASTWGALLSACKIHKLVELAEYVAKKLLPVETDKSSVYVLLFNIYADAGMWDKVKKLRLRFGEKGLHKSAGFSSIEVNEKLYVFTSKTKLASLFTELESVWISVTEQMRIFGHVYDMSFIINDAEDIVKK
ncbi:hypothetical protein DCAR_0208276 [Daucus carota subsp. sativus]|uniref:Uncharacterized protein n=2 Tax=Daucus carota subsp. sativus TaxID=79200 RepID=A0AAF1AQY9_DAUCS|nr:hypothetical protein DCAR_0208276 [Daucus carota subsp. sativus]